MSKLLTRRAALTDIGSMAAATVAAAALPNAVQAATAPASLPAAAIGASTAPRVGGAIDAAELERFIRMRTGPKLAPIMYIYEGVLLGKPDGEVAKPLLRMSGVSFNRAISKGPGRYEWQLDECGYYCDIHSGEVVMDWTNPYTGAVVHPKHYRSPENMIYTTAGAQPAEAMPPGIEFRGEITTLSDSGGVVSMTEDLYVKVPARAATATAPARSAGVMASLATFICAAEALDHAGQRWVDCYMSYNTMNSFAGWMGMEGKAGVQNMRLTGRKHPATDFNAIPTWLRQRIAADHPTFLDVPKIWSR